MARRLNDEEIVAAIEALEDGSHSYSEGDLSEQRAEAIRRYLSLPLGDEKVGRSDVVSSDLRDTVLTIMPQLMRVFLGGDEVVRFAARSPEDEPAAKSESEYMNWLFSERNDAFGNLNAAFTDVLLCGNGYIKAWWDSSTEVQVERYFGKADDEMAMLAQDPDVQIVEHSEYPDPSWVAPTSPQINPATGQPEPVPPQPMLHDLVMRRTRATEYVRYEAVPPEELHVSTRLRGGSLAEADFVQHRKPVTLSELRDMGYDVPDDITGFMGDDDVASSPEALARDRYGFGQDWGDDYDGDPASRQVTFRETFLLIDADGDGRAELRRVCTVARLVLTNEEADQINIAGFVGIPFAHRHQGLSQYDCLRDIEKTKTQIVRQYIDGLRVQNNPRIGVDEDRVNVEDLLISRPNGMVRTVGPPGQSLLPMPGIPVGPAAMEGLQWLETWKQSASGVSSLSSGSEGIDARALGSTASGISQLISQAQMRVESIARSLADGVRDLVEIMHALTLKNATRAEHVKLNNQWVLVDPRSWVKRTDLEVVVALGSGTKEMRVAQLQQMIATQMQLLPTGVVKPENLYAAVSRMANELGYRNADEFVSNPALQPPAPPPPPDPLVAAQQIKTQGELQGKQMQMQGETQRSQMDQQLKTQEMAARTQMDMARAQQDEALAREKMTIDAQTQIEIARIKGEMDVQKAVAIENIKLGAADAERERQGMGESHMSTIVAALAEIQANQAMIAEAVARMQGPRRVLRDQRGRVVGTADESGEVMQEVLRDGTGRVAGIRPPNTIQ